MKLQIEIVSSNFLGFLVIRIDHLRTFPRDRIGNAYSHCTTFCLRILEHVFVLLQRGFFFCYNWKINYPVFNVAKTVPRFIFLTRYITNRRSMRFLGNYFCHRHQKHSWLTNTLNHFVLWMLHYKPITILLVKIRQKYQVIDRLHIRLSKRFQYHL